MIKGDNYNDKDERQILKLKAREAFHLLFQAVSIFRG